ncbi:MAG: deoxyribose-phosphate aldolase [Clostridia bacterium]|nr:deoxyribose-phosphate aldolase [Clostridia bacterium]
MNKNEILKLVDHTMLKQVTTFENIQKLCDDAIKHNVASVCIPPSFVKQAKQYVGNNMKICTVIGFPNGYNTTQTKIFETEDALKNGADEIDMVINIGDLKSGEYDKVKNEIKQIKDVCKDNILKVIIETCLLTESEKINMCEIISDTKADYIKTSTGFSLSGAKLDDIYLFSKYLSNPNVKIKAAGGISSFEDAELFINAGANRLGTSRLIQS